MILPDAEGRLSSPFGDKHMRDDPMPTVESVQSSTDAETEFGLRPGDIEETILAAATGTGAAKNHDMLIAAIKASQHRAAHFDAQTVLAWNLAAAPVTSSRTDPITSPERRERYIQKVTWPLSKNQESVVKRVIAAINREAAQTKDKIRTLREEYRELDEEWKEHCSFLDQIMKDRGPPPADLFAQPGAIPVIMPGSVPVTPNDDIFGSRANRRRGVGDVVTTEAEFQEILAGLADSAAKDPNLRASKTTAVVPEMLISEERHLRFQDENDLVTDPMAFYDFAGTAEPIWTDEERTIFNRRYLAYPKQFGRIADGLPNKTAAECVLFYYRTKRVVDYKGMLASRRGDKKKKAIPIKKSGKSSALLSNLDRQKPTMTINPAYASRGPTSAITPSRAGREDTFGTAQGARRVRMMPGTPNVEGVPGRRRVIEDDDVDSNAGRSRAGSEAPLASKAKMRMTVQTPKRPRLSSVSGSDAPALQLDTTMSPSAYLIRDDGDTATELLPPVKRAGKRRKAADLNDPPVDLSPAEKPSRRTATNSYWSVEEKRKFRDMVAVHGNNVKAIAMELAGKSERQVANFFDAHRSDMKLDEVMPPGTEVDIGRMGVEGDMVSW